MELNKKSRDNIQLVQSCLSRNRYYTAVAGRAYYAVFQLLKYFLIQEEFDYREFLDDIGSGDREFSHGTIKRAVFKQFMSKGCRLQEISILNQIDQLYRTRRKADYDTVEISKIRLKQCYKSAVNIMEYIKNI